MSAKSDQIVLEICRIVRALGAEPLCNYPGIFEHQVDDRWKFKINGHGEAMPMGDGTDLDPYFFFIEYNGWPFATFGMEGGVMGVGVEANEDTLLAALTREADGIEGAANG